MVKKRGKGKEGKRKRKWMRTSGRGVKDNWKIF